MNLQQFRYLVEVSKTNSISKAASALYMTQPSISKSIQDLEKELGIVILDRKNKGVVFTKDGTELLFYAKMMLEQMESIVYHFNKKNAAEMTKMSVSSQHYSFAIAALVGLMNDFEDRNYELTLREGTTSDVIEEVHSGQSIVGVISLTELNRSYFERYFMTKELTFIPLASMRQHVFLRKEHPLSSYEHITLEQLSGYPYLTYQQDDVLLHIAEEAINLEKLGKVVHLKDRGAMNDVLSNTNGYNLGTGCVVKNYMNANIVSIPLEGGCDIQVGYVKRNDVYLTDDIAMYIEHLNQSLNASLPLSI